LADFAAEVINGMGSSGNGLDAPTTHPSATPIPSDPTTLNLAVPPQRIELVRNACHHSVAPRPTDRRP
jgi:hypothetical protein